MPDQLDVAWALAELELSFGGHGNGVYDVTADKIDKGVILPVTEIAKEYTDAKGMVVFHTRLASCGGINGQNCHPFREKGEAGEFVLAHNGHLMGWESYDEWDCDTDTQCMAKLIAKYGLGVTLSMDLSGCGVLLVTDVTTGKLYHIRRGGEFYLMRHYDWKKQPSFFHASEKLHATAMYRNYKATMLPISTVYELLPNGKAHTKADVSIVDPEMQWGKRSYYDMGAGDWIPFSKKYANTGNPVGYEKVGGATFRTEDKETESEGWSPGLFLKESLDQPDSEAWECYCYSEVNESEPYICSGCADFYERHPGEEPFVVYDEDTEQPETGNLREDFPSWASFDVCGVCGRGGFARECRHCGYTPEEAAKLSDDDREMIRDMIDAEMRREAQIANARKAKA